MRFINKGTQLAMKITQGIINSIANESNASKAAIQFWGQEERVKEPLFNRSSAPHNHQSHINEVVFCCCTRGLPVKFLLAWWIYK